MQNCPLEICVRAVDPATPSAVYLGLRHQLKSSSTARARSLAIEFRHRVEFGVCSAM